MPSLNDTLLCNHDDQWGDVDDSSADAGRRCYQAHPVSIGFMEYFQSDHAPEEGRIAGVETSPQNRAANTALPSKPKNFPMSQWELR